MSWDKYQSRDPRRIDPMKTPLYDYVVLDTETTGFKPENGAKLIEIGAVKIHDGKLVDRYEQLIDPHQQSPNTSPRSPESTTAWSSDNPT